MTPRKWRVAAVVAAALIAGVASADTAPRPFTAPGGGPIGIIGGTPVAANEYPSVVALVINRNLCTGTLITPTMVLTAAHCVDPEVLGLGTQADVTNAMTVHFHTTDIINDPGTTATVAATYKDPDFHQSSLGSHDIGLVELVDAVEDVNPSPINLFATMAQPGISVVTIGYGQQSGGSGAAVGTELQLKNRDTVTCSSLDIGSDTNLLCFSATADSTNTCQGDSGGPSFAFIDGKATVVGVTSFGDSTCSKFGASTRVDIEQPFLVQYVSELIGCLKDKDCPDGRDCFNHTCITAPFTDRGIGSVCATGNDCESSECAESSQDGKRCAITCSVSTDGSCPAGFDCLRATGDVGACWPATAAGCCDAGGAGGPAAMLLGLGVMVVARRRRR